MQVNYFIMTLTIAVVLGFQDSTSLSSAYGVPPPPLSLLSPPNAIYSQLQKVSDQIYSMQGWQSRWTCSPRLAW